MTLQLVLFLVNFLVCRFYSTITNTYYTRQWMKISVGVFRCQLVRTLRINQFYKTAYHPQANGMVERFDRQLRSVIEYYESENSTYLLPIVMVNIGTANKENTIKLQLQNLYLVKMFVFLVNFFSSSEFLKNVCRDFRPLCPKQALYFYQKKLTESSHQQPYGESYAVIKKAAKNFVFRIRNGDPTVLLKTCLCFGRTRKRQSSASDHLQSFLNYLQLILQHNLEKSRTKVHFLVILEFVSFSFVTLVKLN